MSIPSLQTTMIIEFDKSLYIKYKITIFDQKLFFEDYLNIAISVFILIYIRLLITKITLSQFRSKA